MFELLFAPYYVEAQFGAKRGWTHQLPFYTQVRNSSTGCLRLGRLPDDLNTCAYVTVPECSHTKTQEELNKQSEHGNYKRQSYSRANAAGNKYETNI